MDDKIQEIQVPEFEVQNLMTAIGKKEVYFNPVKGVGMWLDIDKVRFFQIQVYNGDANDD